MKFWNRHWPHSPTELWVLIHITLVFVGLRILLPHIRLDRALGWLHSPQKSFPPQPTRLALIQRFFHALLWRYRTNPKGDCLIRSLVLFYFARRHGCPVHFHCGVYSAGKGLDGHAWLSLKGQPYLEKDNPFSRYTVTYSFPDQYMDVEDGQMTETFPEGITRIPLKNLQHPVEFQ